MSDTTPEAREEARIMSEKKNCPDCGGYNPKECRRCKEAAIALADAILGAAEPPPDPVDVAALGKVIATIEDGGRAVAIRITCPRCSVELDPYGQAAPKDGCPDSCPECSQGFSVAEEIKDEPPAGAGPETDGPPEDGGGERGGGPEDNLPPNEPPDLTPLEQLLATAAGFGRTAETIIGGLREGRIFEGVGIYHRAPATSVVAADGGAARHQIRLTGMVISIQAAATLAKIVRACEKTPLGEGLKKKLGDDLGVRIETAKGPLIEQPGHQRPS